MLSKNICEITFLNLFKNIADKEREQELFSWTLWAPQMGFRGL